MVVSILVGASTTTTQAGAHYVAFGKFAICPDGGGGIGVTILELKPGGLTNVGPWEIVIDWEMHSNSPE